MLVNRSLLNASRFVHAYLSIVLLVALVFFALTGITLNNTAVFSAEPVTTDFVVSDLPMLPRDAEGRIVASPELETLARERFGVRLPFAALSYEDELLVIDYQSPGHATLVEIDQELGEAYVEDTDFGLVAVLNDLHKGRNVDMFWHWLIDVSGVVLVLFSLAGFVLLLPNGRRLRQVLAWSGGATLLVGAGYWLGTL